MRILRQQYGMTPLATITILVLVAFGVYLILKLAPVYIENYAVASSLKSLKQDLDIREKAPEQVYDLLKRRFEINDVKSVKKENVKLPAPERSSMSMSNMMWWCRSSGTSVSCWLLTTAWHFDCRLRLEAVTWLASCATVLPVYTGLLLWRRKSRGCEETHPPHWRGCIT